MKAVFMDFIEKVCVCAEIWLSCRSHPFLTQKGKYVYISVLGSFFTYCSLSFISLHISFLLL